MAERIVTEEYLAELYAKADRLRAVEGRLVDAEEEIDVLYAFAEQVLFGDTYGCNQNGPGKCLHGDARRVLDSIKSRV